MNFPEMISIEEIERRAEQETIETNRQEKLNALADALEKVEVLEDGSLYLKTKSHLVIESVGNQVMYSEEGDIVLKGKMTHLQPVTPIKNARDSQQFVDRMRVKAEELKTQLIEGNSNEHNSCVVAKTDK